jgi:hypothetical protein
MARTSSDESDWDDWADSMLDASNQTTSQAQGGRDLTDDGWECAHIDAYQDDTVKPEDHAVWQQLQSSAVQKLAVNSPRAQRAVRDWLLCFIPHTCRLLGMIGISQPSPYDMFVDSIVDPSAITMSSANGKVLQLTCFSTHQQRLETLLVTVVSEHKAVQAIELEGLSHAYRATAERALAVAGFATGAFVERPLCVLIFILCGGCMQDQKNRAPSGSSSKHHFQV